MRGPIFRPTPGAEHCCLTARCCPTPFSPRSALRSARQTADVRLHLIAWATVLTSLTAHIAAALWLYRVLKARIASGQTRALNAAGIFCLAMFAIPYPLMWFDFRIGWFLYSKLPAFSDPAWDVGMAMLSLIGLLVSAAISLVFTIFAAWKYQHRESRGASAT
jgi:hypothetical protein